MPMAMTHEPPRKRARTKQPRAPAVQARVAVSPARSAASTVVSSATIQVPVSKPAVPTPATPPPSVASERTAALEERSLAAATAPAPANESRGSPGTTFLRLSASCKPSAKIAKLVYLNRPTTVFGRAPNCDVVLDSASAPRMISRVHGRVSRVEEAAGPQWQLSDGGSMNGILVNDDSLSRELPHVLKPGDVITFGRKMSPPEFEFVFESAGTPVPGEQEAASARPSNMSSLDEVFQAQMKKIEEERKEIEAERKELARRQSEAKRPSKTALEVSDLESELLCCVCRDWIVQAQTLDCAHSFCGECLDTWLQQKKFECPVCRHEVKREPVASRTLDTIIKKSVGRLSAEDQADFEERRKHAESATARRKRHHAELEKSVNEAIAAGKAFFSINGCWSKKEKNVFQQGVKDYLGDTREVYCKLTSLTVQWIHSADDSALNRALHNLGLQDYVTKEEHEIRQRILMFLRYG